MIGTLERWVLIAGAVAILAIVLEALGIKVPAWAVKMFWVIVIVCAGILALRLLGSM